MCLVARYVLGHDAMRKMGKSNVLISGMKGLGVEVGKQMQLQHLHRCSISHDSGYSLITGPFEYSIKLSMIHDMFSY